MTGPLSRQEQEVRLEGGGETPGGGEVEERVPGTEGHQGTEDCPGHVVELTNTIFLLSRAAKFYLENISLQINMCNYYTEQHLTNKFQHLFKGGLGSRLS